MVTLYNFMYSNKMHHNQPNFGHRWKFGAITHVFTPKKCCFFLNCNFLAYLANLDLRKRVFLRQISSCDQNSVDYDVFY